MNAQTPQKFTLEEIAERKKKLLNEIHAQKKAMTATTREIFAPLAPATNKADAIMRSFNTGMAVFDGFFSPWGCSSSVLSMPTW